MTKNNNDDSKRELWDRQPGEKVLNFERFVFYRDDPERSHERVAKKFGVKHTSVINRQATDGKWTKRLKAWTDHLNTIKVNVQESDAQNMKARMIKNAIEAQKVLMKPIKAMTKIPIKDYSEMTPAKLAGLARSIVPALVDISKLELTLRGEASEINKSNIDSTVDFDGKLELSDNLEELSHDELIELKNKYDKRHGLNNE